MGLPSRSATVLTELGVPDESTLRAMQALGAVFPERSTHVIDLPYRLSSPDTGPPRAGGAVETALWHERAGGDLVGWALWVPAARETDIAVHPRHAAVLEREALTWSGERALALARSRGEPLFWWVAAREDNPERIALLEADGFARQKFVTLRYERQLAAPLPPPALPAGYQVRPLAGAEEVLAYVESHQAAFGSTAMTVDWRRRVLQAPGYEPELDLVVAAPDGRVAAFAILWLGPAVGQRREGQFEPVGTHPEFQRRGLGRAAMLEGMRRLAAAGATHAVVETENVRAAANALYRSVMQETGIHKLHFRKRLQ